MNQAVYPVNKASIMSLPKMNQTFERAILDQIDFIQVCVDILDANC